MDGWMDGWMVGALKSLRGEIDVSTDCVCMCVCADAVNTLHLWMKDSSQVRLIPRS